MQYYHTFGTKKPMHFHILTIFPEMFAGPLSESIIKRAIQAGRISVGLYNIRDYALDKHHTTDDAPYGGGAGMVMKAEPLAAAIRAVLPDTETRRHGDTETREEKEDDRSSSAPLLV